MGDLYEVVENAGYVGECVVAEHDNESDARDTMCDMYSSREQDDLHVAIRCNGSYEF